MMSVTELTVAWFPRKKSTGSVPAAIHPELKMDALSDLRKTAQEYKEYVYAL